MSVAKESVLKRFLGKIEQIFNIGICVNSVKYQLSSALVSVIITMSTMIVDDHTRGSK